MINVDEMFEKEHQIVENGLKLVDDNSENVTAENYSALLKNYIKLLKQHEKIIKISDNFQKSLRVTQSSLKTLLDNAEEGFLTINKEKTIDREYSYICRKIFGEDISGKNCIELMFSKEDNEIEKEAVERIFLENEDKAEVYCALLPEETSINGYDLKIKYKLIEVDDERKLMCIIYDFTEQNRLNKKIVSERYKLHMVLAALKSENRLKKYIKEYKDFVNYKIYDILFEGESVLSSLKEIFIQIHTYKGIFGQFFMKKFESKLNGFETKLETLIKSEINSISEAGEFFSIECLEDYCKEEIIFINESLDRDIFKDVNNISVRYDDIEKVEKMLENSSEENILNAKECIRKFKFRTIMDILKSYEKYTISIAETKEKLIDKFVINCTNNGVVDEDYYYGAIKSLIHIFKNIVAHGIEAPDTREERGKKRSGNIKIEYTKKDGICKIKIADDGAGIDSNKIIEKAVKKGIISKEKADKMSKYEKMQLIFFEGFSTQEESCCLAGRGVGLASVKKELETIGGKISVDSEYGKWTEFTLEIPVLKGVE